MQYPVRSGPIVNDPATVLVETQHNVYPDRPRLPRFQNPPIPSQDWNFGLVAAGVWDISQRGFNSWRPNLTHGAQTPIVQPPPPDQLPNFEVDAPSRPRIPERIHTMKSVFAVIGVKDVFLSPPLLPARPNLMRGARIPLPICEVHTVPPLNSPEIYEGSHPDRNRQLLATKTPLPFAHVDTVTPPSSPEMYGGNHPDRNRQTLGVKIPLPVSMPDTFNNFSNEMVNGSMPHRSRVLLGQRIPLPIAHVTTEMEPAEFAGQHPDRIRLFHSPRLPQSIYPAEGGKLIQEFLSAHPDTPRLPYHKRTADIGASIQWMDIIPPPPPPQPVVCIPFRDDSIGTGSNRPSAAGTPVSRANVKPKDCKSD